MSKSTSSNSSVNSFSKDFSPTELAEIKEAFQMFDIDGGGTSLHYWEHGIRHLGLQVYTCIQFARPLVLTMC